jgi:hypothetical protein
MAKSRFTKSFYFLSTVFVDNFVDNEEINYIHPGHKVYDLLNVVQEALLFLLKNQLLTTPLRAGENTLPVISAAKKNVHKSVLLVHKHQ